MNSRPPDPLDDALERLDRADQATELLEYSADYDEPTGRTEVTVNMQNPHPPQQSYPMLDAAEPAPARGIRVVLTAVDSWHKVAALLILVVGLLAGYWLRSR